MSLEISEREMLDRFSDGLRRSADIAGQFKEAEERKKPSLFITFVDGLKIAAGSAHQLSHSQQNPNWLSVRDKLESVIEVSQKLVYIPGIFDTPLWGNIKVSLEEMNLRGRTMGMAKSMPRHEVLESLKIRQSKINHDG